MAAFSIASFFGRVSQTPITHLRAQKLSFYGYSALLALGSVRKMTWWAWKHGPVNRELYQQLRSFRAEAIPPSHWQGAPPLEDSAQCILRQVNTVYSLLDTWELRAQTHEEWVWQTTLPGEEIAHDALHTWARETFVEKIRFPVLLMGPAWLELEGIAPTFFQDFKSLSDECMRIANAY